MIVIRNNGPLLAETSYWDSEHARAGLFYASWNAGALRLLVPDVMRSALDEMRTGEFCELRYVSVGGRPALEIFFEDRSESPFQLVIDNQQADRVIAPEERTGAPRVLAYTRDGLQHEWRGVWYDAKQGA